MQDAESWAVPGMESSSSTAEITTLQQLEQVVQEAGSQIVVVAFYSRVRIPTSNAHRETTDLYEPSTKCRD